MQTDKILDANDKANEEGHPDATERLKKMMRKFRIKFIEGKTPPMYAYVERGRWLVECSCGGKEYVAKGCPVMCFSCGNSEVRGVLRSVVFPRNKEAIEDELLKRDVIVKFGLSETQRSRSAMPKYGNAVRSWDVGETIADLKRQHKQEKEKVR